MSSLLGLESPRPASGEYDNVPVGPDAETEARAKRGASWFYWIAALSAVNSIAFLAGTGYHFLAGLGFTEIVDAVAEASIQQGAPSSIKVIAIVFDLIIIIAFALAGYFSHKLISGVFLTGIIVYAIDAVIVLLLGDFLMAAFHAFALYQLIRGFIACRELKAHYKAAAVAAQPAIVPPPPTF